LDHIESSENLLACDGFIHLYNNFVEVRIGLRSREVTGSTYFIVCAMAEIALWSLGVLPD
jgi:hypothetical protein